METEEHENNTPASQLPDTQNAESQCFTQSQDTVLVTPQLPWGRLCPHYKDFEMTELIKDEYTFGRMDKCDIKADKLPNKKQSVISKIHFRIYRQTCTASNGVEDDIIYLKDESQNGTFVNGTLVGKGNSVILENNDLIAVAKVHLNVFVFMSINAYTDSSLPEEIKCKYAVSRTLGAGACGEVKLCFSKSRMAGKKYAMKIIEKKKFSSISDQKNCTNNEKQILNEVEICKRFRHPCIIKVEEFFNTPAKLYIVLELMEGGELFERIKKTNGLKEKHAKFLFYQIILAVNYLHQNGITHRDLKPENILLASHEDETIVKVSDFGLSKIVDSQTMMKTFCGTPMYVAPEILITGGAGSYNCQVDVWSLGVILYCCLTGLTPFKVHDKNNVLFNQIIKGMYDFNVPQFLHISTAAKDLIRRMMTVDPEKRITIRSALIHPWFNDREMRTKVNNLLGITSNENVLPKKNVTDNIPNLSPKLKKARLD